MAGQGFLDRDQFLTPELLWLALDASDTGAWVIDPISRRLELTSRLRRSFDFGEKPLELADFLARLHPDDRDSAQDTIDRVLTGSAGDGYAGTVRITTADGRLRWLEASGRLCRIESGNAPGSAFIGTIRDVTRAMDAEATRQKAAEDQYQLANELNHRVKNSLQLVSSLLRLQARRINGAEARRQLEDATARIQTIARLHQRLYHEGDFRSISFGSFLSELCADLQASAPHCRVAVETCDLRVKTDRAIPLALIVTELVGNALTHAYPGRGGPIRVALVRRPEGVSVEVSDEGVGLPEGFSPSRAPGFGMTLISSLAGQIGGRLEVLPRSRGTAFAIHLVDSGS